MVCQKPPRLFSVRRKHWNETIRPLPHFRPLPNDRRLDGGRETSMFLGHFLSLQRYQNLPTPTAGIPFARLDPYLVPPDGLYGGPKSLPDGGESSLISGELSSTLQMGKSSSPLMCRTRPVGSGYIQHKTRCMQSVIIYRMQFYLDEGCCVYRNPLFWVCLHPQGFVPAVKECVCVCSAHIYIQVYACVSSGNFFYIIVSTQSNITNKNGPISTCRTSSEGYFHTHTHNAFQPVYQPSPTGQLCWGDSENGTAISCNRTSYSVLLFQLCGYFQ